jgi:cytochrome c
VGSDEINQGRKAGNFGWLFFDVNNKSYRGYNFSSGKLGELYDSARPVNNSPNYTGSKNLPPAPKAFMCYPYLPSKEFPLA